MKRTGIAAVAVILAAVSLAGAGETELDFDGRGVNSGSFADMLAGAAVPAAPSIKAFTLDSQSNDMYEDGHYLGFVPPIYSISHLSGRSIIPSGKRGAGAFPAQYDLRVLGKVSPVKDQGNCGSCWAHATLAALESALLPQETWDFSEQNVKNTVGFDRSHCDGGNADMVTAYLTRWSGPVAESDDPYDITSGDSPYNLSPKKHVQEILTIPPRANALDNKNIKWALTSFGAVASSMYWSRDPLSYDKVTFGYYYAGPNAGSNHLVTIVGWDDNFDKNKFSKPAPGNGAFIVKNSWGTSWGNKGFFYISYYDTVFGKYNTVYSAVEGVANYDHIYQYDPFGLTDYTDAAGEASYFANVFTSKHDETVTAAGFYTRDLNVNYEADVYVDVSTSTPATGHPAAVSKGTIAIPGFHTIAVPPVKVTKAQRFSVVIRFEKNTALNMVAIEDPQGGASRASANAGESFLSGDGINWSDLTEYYPNANVCLKAYTKGN